MQILSTAHLFILNSLKLNFDWMHYEAQWIQFFFHKGYELYDAFESLRSNLCPLEQKTSHLLQTSFKKHWVLWDVEFRDTLETL